MTSGQHKNLENFKSGPLISIILKHKSQLKKSSILAGSDIPET